MTPYRCRPHELRGSSGQTSLVAATSKSVRFARSLVTPSDGGQTHLHTCLSAQASGRETRVDAVRWHAGRSLSQLCIAYQRFNNMAVKIIHFPPVIPRLIRLLIRWVCIHQTTEFNYPKCNNLHKHVREKIQFPLVCNTFLHITVFMVEIVGSKRRW